MWRPVGADTSKGDDAHSQLGRPPEAEDPAGSLLLLRRNKGTIMNGKVFCRICGHRDSSPYCSQCGLPIDLGLDKMSGYLFSRFRMLLEPTTQFLVTALLLIGCPRRFFQRLFTAGEPVNISLIAAKRHTVSSFKAWRRPMTPVGYLVSGTALFVVSGTRLGFSKPVREILELLSFDLSSAIFDTSLAIVLEMILLIVLFALLLPYERILGIKKDYKGRFFEFFSYSVAHFLICGLLITLVSAHLGDSEWAVLGYPLFSVAYFLVVPLLVFPNEFEVTVWRIVVAFLVLFVFKTGIFAVLSVGWVLLYPGILAVFF